MLFLRGRPGPQKPVCAVRFGVPYVEIIRYSRENDIDLIVVGSHGRTGLSHVLLGSVAERVIRKSACPVMTARQSPDDEDNPVSAGGRHKTPAGHD